MTATVRYIVPDAGVARDFYRDALGFTVDMDAAPAFAVLHREDLRLMFNQPGAGGAGQPSDAGEAPAPGGWNRIQLPVDDVAAAVERLVTAGARLRTSPVTGAGGVQAVVEDPSGNPIELIAAPGPARSS